MINIFSVWSISFNGFDIGTNYNIGFPQKFKSKKISFQFLINDIEMFHNIKKKLSLT